MCSLTSGRSISANLKPKMAASRTKTNQRQGRNHFKCCAKVPLLLIIAIAIFIVPSHLANSKLDTIAVSRNVVSSVDRIPSTGAGTIFLLGRNRLFPLTQSHHPRVQSCCGILLILLAGDISINPGPIRYPCSVCGKAVATNHRAISCDECQSWVHIKCGKIDPKTYENMKTTSCMWICPI